MNWHDILLESLKDKDQLKRMSELARQPRNYQVPTYDYKQVQAEGREPGEDD